MKQLYLLLFIAFSASFSAQNTDSREDFYKKEIRAHQKMLAYNTNPNTANYDLKYQRLEASLDPAVNYITASVTSHFQPNTPISEIYFDFTKQLTVSSVKYHGNSLAFTQLPTKEIKITLPNSVNSLDSLTLNYSGVPDPANQAFLTSTQNGSPVLFTLSEPYGAQDWFPTKQSMNDKIDRFDFKITAPSQYTVAANGKLMSETTTGNSKTTFWRTQYPMAAYLAAISVTDFTKINDVIGNPPFPFVNYLYPSTAGSSLLMGNINWTKQAMQNFENYFGPYPFRNEKYGHMEFSYGGTCMEHQTMSSMSSYGKDVIAHELAHQWFGDKVTCGSWNDIWLNEGFAVFGEHLTNEKLLMTNAEFLNYLQGQKNYITSQVGGSVYVADANLGNQNYIFSSRLSYAKGGYLLRMMKWILGDDAFYQAIKDYNSRANLAYNYATTADLKNSLLQSTGKDFTEFFGDWLYGQGYPTYTIKWNQVGNALTFNVSQVQSHSSVSFFEMPLPIKVNGTNGETAYFKLNNTSNNQNFAEQINFTVKNIEFNYEYQILEKNSTVQKDTALPVENLPVETPDFGIFANPATGLLEISGIADNSEYKIYDRSGRLIKSGNYRQPIPMQGITAGAYVISVAGKNVKFVKR